MSALDLQVIIVSYNVRDLLRACVRSVLERAEAEGISAQVLVWDNASGDGSAEMVAVEFPQVRVEASDVNSGFTGGTNAALQVVGAGERPVLLLNPDVELTPGALTTLLRDVTTLPRAGVVGPRLIYPDGMLQHSAFRFPGLAQAFLEAYPINWRLTESSLNGRYPREESIAWPYLCDHPLGAAMMLHPDMLREVGGMDLDYFLYCEEVDWCRRARQAGWDVWSDPRAVVIHHSGMSTRQSRGPSFVRLWRSRLRYFRKHHGVTYAQAIAALTWLTVAAERRRLGRALHRGELSRDAAAETAEALDEVARVAGGRV